jgi:hypothetical protein
MGKKRLPSVGIAPHPPYQHGPSAYLVRGGLLIVICTSMENNAVSSLHELLRNWLVGGGGEGGAKLLRPLTEVNGTMKLCSSPICLH